jgi:transcriptional repressor NrdR
MRCPHCHGQNDKVIESRHNADGTSIRRRRECLDCGYRFTSYEHIEEKQLMVVKRDGRREPFDRRKLERGIQTSLEKRPVPQPKIEEMVQKVEDEAVIREGGAREISSEQIGEMVLAHLYELDKVGYVRFASVYKMFEDIDAFKQELDRLFTRGEQE